MDYRPSLELEVNYFALASEEEALGTRMALDQEKVERGLDCWLRLVRLVEQSTAEQLIGHYTLVQTVSRLNCLDDVEEQSKNRC